ncbi:MAG: DUF2075 domain-containing protein, partial [Paenibacillaceae bacterium]|nr:DUF2075 domain-containing protein [Paenibacillaceae bacterium]
VLESLAENERTLVSGVAGAGKTLLGMEQARRMYWTGKQVLYICFNKNISEYVQYQFAKEGLDITACTLHSLMMNGEIPDAADQNFFEKILPEQFLRNNSLQEYDYLIVDEGQDLFRDAYLPCLGKIVKGQLGDGCWLIFYDQNQNLYNDNDQFDTSLSKLKKCGAATYKLSVNCRNTKQIADANTLTTGISNIGKPKISGLSVKYIPFSDKAEEHKLLNDLLLELKNDGVCGGDLIILSKYAITNPQNCLNRNPVSKTVGLMKTSGQLWRARKTEVRFSTISAYKGLESKAVVLIDVDGFSEQTVRLLNYVAISRASSLLYILYDSQKEHERQNMMVSSFIRI